MKTLWEWCKRKAKAVAKLVLGGGAGGPKEPP